jgi:transposase
MAVQVDSVVLLEAHQPGSRQMFELTDEAFARVQPLLPNDSRRGKPWRDHRQVLGGILWKLHTGRPWRDVPGRFGPWQTGYGRLGRWQRDGTWPRVWAVLAAELADSPDDRRGQALLASAPVTAADTGWGAAPPHRPPQHLPHAGRVHHTRATSSRRASAVETLIRSEPGGCGSSARSAAPRAHPTGGGLGADRRQEPLGDQDQAGVPVPGVIAADLVVVQADLAFAGLEAFLHRPAHARHPHQFGQRGLRRPKQA